MDWAINLQIRSSEKDVISEKELNEINNKYEKNFSDKVNIPLLDIINFIL